MAEKQNAVLDSREDFQTPREMKDYWQTELKSAKNRLKDWQNRADRIVNRYLGHASKNNAVKMFNLNLFNSNVKTMMSMMYGKLPRVDVSRTDKTGNDDAARVAAEMMENLLRANVANKAQTYDSILYSTLQDRMLSGLGVARVRYVMQEIVEETTEELGLNPANSADPIPPQGVVPLFQNVSKSISIFEDAPIEYYYWADVLWGWGRSFDDLPWIAFRSYLDKDEMTERFGEEVARTVEYKQQQVSDLPDSSGSENQDLDSAWNKTEVWEIWDKTTKKVCWFSFSYPKMLDSKEDPLKLTGFYPCPPFMIANPTTSLYIPTPDFELSQDLYNEIDMLQTRIAVLTEAVKVVGVYDKSAEGLQRMFKEGTDNSLIPVDNWAMFAERGGIKGTIDWVPIQDVVNSLDKLRQLRDETIGLLQQITGMSDLMRGNLDNPYEGVGQSQIKAKFGSARAQALQEVFAGFVANLMQIKAEIVARHFSPETIIAQSGMKYSFDSRLIPQAMDVLKNPDEFQLRVEIKPETMAQMDYAQLREERTLYLNGLSTFLQSASPLAQQDPRSLPFLLQMLKWAMAGFKGSSEIEGVLDMAIDAMSQPQAQREAKKPSAEEQRGQIQLQLEQMRIQAKQQEMQMSLQFEMQKREHDRQADIQTEQARAQLEAMRIQAETAAEIAKLQAKMEADVHTEYMTSMFDAEQARETAQAQVEAALIKARADLEAIKMEKFADFNMRAFEKGIEAAMKKDEMRLNRMSDMDEGEEEDETDRD